MARRPPDQLSKEARRLWRQLVNDYDLKDERSLHLLALACEQFDRAQEAARSIAEHGAIVLDRYGNPKQNPAVGIEVRAQKQHMSALKAALSGKKRTDRVAEEAKSASVVALHEFMDNRRVK